MNISRYLVPASIAATLHVAFMLGFNPVAGPITRIIEVPLGLPPVTKIPDDPVVSPPEEKPSSTEAVRPLAGGPIPPDIDPPAVLPKDGQIPIPDDARRPSKPTTDVKTIPMTIGQGGDGPVGTVEWTGGPVSLGDLDRVPRATVQVSPDFPATMRQQGITGSVTVEFAVDTEGRVVRAEAVRYTHREFAEPAVRAVLKWHFEPGRRHGRAVPFRMAVPMEFGMAAD